MFLDFRSKSNVIITNTLTIFLKFCELDALLVSKPRVLNHRRK